MNIPRHHVVNPESRPRTTQSCMAKSHAVPEHIRIEIPAHLSVHIDHVHVASAHIPYDGAIKLARRAVLRDVDAE